MSKENTTSFLPPTLRLTRQTSRPEPSCCLSSTVAPEASYHTMWSWFPSVTTSDTTCPTSLTSNTITIYKSCNTSTPTTIMRKFPLAPCQIISRQYESARVNLQP